LAEKQKRPIIYLGVLLCRLFNLLLLKPYILSDGGEKKEIVSAFWDY
jgi:hypothetical protein